MRIIGSETEFGLVSKERADCFKILGLAGRRFWESGIPGKEEREEFVRMANWWKEDLTIEEKVDEKLKTADTLRRLGMSGEYLPNGSRFYVDGGHLEYSTAECASPWDLIAYERAGENIVSDFVEKAKTELGVHGDLLKRNSNYKKKDSDYEPASYAWHGNFCLSRELFDKLVPPEGQRLSFSEYASFEQAVWTMHLISMQFVIGSGRIDPNLNWPECFGLSQRQPFIEHFAAVETTTARSVVNLRDRPYADPKRFGRLHVICWDSNRADWSNLLKCGPAMLLLAALENRTPEYDADFFRAVNPVGTFRSIKNKNSEIVTVGGTITALQAQRLLWAFVKDWYDSVGIVVCHVAGEILEAWKEALDLIETDDKRIYSMFDHFIKKKIFEDDVSRGDSTTRDLQSLEYFYHLVGDGSLFTDLVRRGLVEEVIPDSSVARAIDMPPQTRAQLRRKLIELMAPYGGVMPSWHGVFAGRYGKRIVAVMPNPSSFAEYEIIPEREVRFKEGGY